MRKDAERYGTSWPVIALYPALPPAHSLSRRRLPQGHEHTVSAVAFINDSRLVSASYDKTVRVWDLTTGFVVNTLQVSGLS